MVRVLHPDRRTRSDRQSEGRASLPRVDSIESVKDVDQSLPGRRNTGSGNPGRLPCCGFIQISVDERTETKRAASAPTGGDLARGGADPAAGSTLSDVAHAADTAQTLHVFALKVRNETIGEWVNAPVSPGTNFSWAPAPLQLLAFARREGGPIIVLDAVGSKQELSGTKAALLPAWSSDGKRLAWIERKGKKYQLTTSELTVQ